MLYVLYRRDAQYRGGVQYCGGYHDACGDILSTVEIFSTVTDIMIIAGEYLEYHWGGGVGDHEYRGDIMSTVGRYLEFKRECCRISLLGLYEPHGFLFMVDHRSPRLPEILQFFPLASLHSKIKRHCIFLLQFTSRIDWK